MGRTLRFCALLLIAVGAASIALATDSAWRPSPQMQVDVPNGDPLTQPLALSAAERTLFIDAADGRLDEHSLVDSALIACGIDNPAPLEHYRRQFAAVCDELRQAAAQTTDISARIELIHRLLHQRLLHGGYDANATNLAGTFDTGIYNCETATLLFVALAEQLNLNAHAIELPGHVRAVVEAGDQICEIEATCPAWSGAARWSSFSGGSRPAPPASDGPSREVNALGLIAMIYYNQGVDAVYHNRYAEAVAANRKALLLDPNNTTARGNLLAAVNNWALALSDVGRLNEAQSLLASGSRFAPKHLPFLYNAAHVKRLQSQSMILPKAIAHPAPSNL